MLAVLCLLIAAISRAAAPERVNNALRQLLVCSSQGNG